MANSLNSTNDSFIFNFPADFVPKIIEDKYKIILNNMHISYSTILDYINHSIKSISIPALTFPTVKQSKTYGKERLFRGSTSPYDLYGRDFIIVLKNVDFHINYLIIQDCLFYHYIKAAKPFLDTFTVTTIDGNRRELFKIYFREVLEKGLSDLVLSNHQGNEHEEKDMTVSFACNFIDIEFIPEYGSDLDDATLIEKYSDQIINNTYGTAGIAGIV